MHLDSAPLVTVDVIGADTISPTGGLHTFATFKLWMAWKAMLFQWLEANTSIICLKEIHIPMPLPFFPAGCDCLPECILNVGKRNQWCKSHWWWQWAFKNCKIDLYLNHQHEKKNMVSNNSSIATYWTGSVGKVPLNFWWIPGCSVPSDCRGQVASSIKVTSVVTLSTPRSNVASKGPQPAKTWPSAIGKNGRAGKNHSNLMLTRFRWYNMFEKMKKMPNSYAKLL